MSPEIECIKSNENSIDSTFLQEEVSNVKHITLDLHKYCCELEKIIKDNSVDNVNSSHKPPVKAKKWVCKICNKSYVAINLLTQHTFNVHEKQRFPCTFEHCKKRFATPNGVKIQIKRHTAAKIKMCN